MQAYHAASTENTQDDVVIYSDRENIEHYTEQLTLCKIHGKKRSVIYHRGYRSYGTHFCITTGVIHEAPYEHCELLAQSQGIK